MIWLFVVPLWFVSFLCAASVGYRKGSPFGAAFLGLMLGPLGLLVVLASGASNRTACPHCAEQIMKTAKVCPHCKLQVAG